MQTVYLYRMRQPRQCPLLQLAALCLVVAHFLRRDGGALALSSLSSDLNHHQHHRTTTAFSFTIGSTPYQHQHQHQSSSLSSVWTLLAKTTNNDDMNDSADVVADSNTVALLPFLSSSIVSRRDAVWKVPIGVAFAFGYGKLASQVVANTIRGTVYPEAHESRVRSTIEQTLLAAAAAVENRRTSTSRTLRVLEVGIGNEARILRRGLYEPALRQLASSASSSSFLQSVELTGLDIQLPSSKIQQKVQREQQSTDDKISIPVQVSFVQQSVEDMSFAQDGYFDAIVCCLTLCSVDNPWRAVQEIQRVLNPQGGTLGFVEHVAVNLDNDHDHEESSYRFLELQQRVLNPVQQLVADNCHLHRSTQETIYDVMGVGTGSSSSRAKVLNEERFLVDAMWPVSMQCCGVVQRLS
jgi:ubiquinone/menaquinone biosynthesis C-methylase UbiE